MYRSAAAGVFRTSFHTFAAVAILSAAASASAQSFVNWETPQVSPLAITPDNTKLLAVNTSDNRLELFDITRGAPAPLGGIAVGLDPVSVRCASSTEAWVVNHISDSVSIIDLVTRKVTRTLLTADEPTDVAFANGRAFVVCSQANAVLVYNLAAITAAPTTLTIEGEDPRSAVVSPDGTKVYVAVFESGNNSAIAPPELVSNAASPYGGQNPPPNSGTLFSPPQRAGNPAPPATAMILKRNSANQWQDDNSHIWSNALVPWALHDHDVAVIDTATLGVTYINSLMNICMHIGVRADGRLFVVGTDATNQKRFEPNLTGTFVHSLVASVNPANPVVDRAIVDLNPHLAAEYAANTSSVEQARRDLSIADPRGVTTSADGVTYITGMGSNNVIKLDAALAPLARTTVGEGPTGIALDSARARLYVLNKFEGSVSTIDTTTDTELGRTSLFDPTPAAIKIGRPFLYDAHLTSGLGVTSCGACHVDARMDQLAWDLGAPDGLVKPFNQTCQVFGCENWHPMKGPMTTQTLQGIVGTEPLHWRGDRENLAAFNPAFQTLLGDDEQLSVAEMAAFEAFIATIKFPPNPNRNLDSSLKTSLAGGNAVTGQNLFMNTALDGNGLATCNFCHTVPDGTSGQITPAIALMTSQSQKIPELRNMHEKTGFLKTSTNNNRGFGFTHDGEKATLVEFLQFPGFSFAGGATGNQQRLDVAAFMLSFATDTHAAVGQQLTFTAETGIDAGMQSQLTQFIGFANTSAVGLVARGVIGGVPRGYRYNSAGVFQSDRAGETTNSSALIASATASGGSIVFTVVPFGSQTRIGIDRDEDGFFDRDEVEQCGDPANALIGPGHFVTGDSNGDGLVNNFDIDAFVMALLDPIGYALAYPQANHGCNNDINHDGAVNNFDIDPFVALILGP